MSSGEDMAIRDEDPVALMRHFLTRLVSVQHNGHPRPCTCWHLTFSHVQVPPVGLWMITRPSFGAADDTKVRVLAEPAAFGQNILAARLLCCCSDGCGLLRNSGRFRCRPQGLVYRRAADLNVKFPSNFFQKSFRWNATNLGIYSDESATGFAKKIKQFRTPVWCSHNLQNGLTLGQQDATALVSGRSLTLRHFKRGHGHCLFWSSLKVRSKSCLPCLASLNGPKDPLQNTWGAGETRANKKADSSKTWMATVV